MVGKQEIIKRLLGFCKKKPNSITFPLIRNTFPGMPAGDHNYKGNTNLEDINFEKLIPPESEFNLEEWFKKKFEEQNIDSSIRGQVLEILIEVGLKLNQSQIHHKGFSVNDIVGVQPMTGPSVAKLQIKYLNKWA